jgi:DEAD/DEAH box helicase domain-containing protein
MIRSPFTEHPTVYLYDTCPGGVGFSRRIYQQFETILAAAAEHVDACPCARGCPSCVGPGVESGDAAKIGAAWILKAAVSR